MGLGSGERRALAAKGNRLKAHVIIRADELSDATVAHVRRAFGDRELIKVRISTDDRQQCLLAAQELAARGAHFVTVPSAFTPHTGKDHWEILLRARAIENQVFVVAPAQCGRHSADRSSHGHSLIIDPWGVVLAQLGDRPGVAVADCALEALERVRESLPALRHRRL